MAFKAVLASMLLVQSALGQCIGRAATPCGLAGNGLVGGCGMGLAGGYGAGLAGGYGTGLAGGFGAGCGSGVASTGGGLPVSSASPGAPVGVSVLSENAYEGQLSAGGNLPFLGSVGIEGVLPTAGAGAVSYGCGDGAVDITSEAPIGTGIISGQSFAPSAGLINQAIGGFGGINGNGLSGMNGFGLGGVNGYGYGGMNGFGLGGVNGFGLGGINGCGLGGAAGYGLGAGAGCGCSC